MSFASLHWLAGLRFFRAFAAGRGLSVAVLFLVVSVCPGSASTAQSDTFDSVVAVYQNNREQGIGNYVTPDLALLSYSLLREKHIISIERDSIIPEFTQFLTLLHTRLLAERSSVSDDVDQDSLDAVEANVRYIELVQALLDEEPPVATDALQQEYARVLAADGIYFSDYWGRRVDYSQFKVRGRYASDALTGGYFRAYRYASSMLFAVQPSASTGLSADMAKRQFAQASTLVSVIASYRELALLKHQLDLKLAALFGPADDLTDKQWHEVEQAYQNQKSDKASDPPATPIMSPAEHMLAYARDNNRQPLIYSELVNLVLLEEGLTVGDVLTGWRLFASRYSADKAVNQALIYPSTDEYLPEPPSDSEGQSNAEPFGLSIIGGKQVKGFPSAYESAALLGNGRAERILHEARETAFTGYDHAYQAARKRLAQASGIEALHNMVVTQGSLVEDESLAEQRLESLLGFQTWQRYLEILYTKQSYTPVGKGLVDDPVRTHADLEPAAGLYLALSAAALMQHKLFASSDWQNLSEHCLRLARLSHVRAAGGQLTSTDINFLNSTDHLLAGLSGAKDRPVVIDVHTEPGSARVVQFAVGRPHVMNVNGLRGARMSFHQFKRPLASRMTDTQWQQLAD